jgi:hypothetical protein
MNGKSHDPHRRQNKAAAGFETGRRFILEELVC